MSDDMRFLIECMARDIIGFLTEEYNISSDRAMEVLFNSKTFKLLEDPETGLYYQSPLYVFEYLKEELGK